LCSAKPEARGKIKESTGIAYELGTNAGEVIKKQADSGRQRKHLKSSGSGWAMKPIAKCQLWIIKADVKSCGIKTKKPPQLTAGAS
jgi:hypothetical protein